MLVKFLPQKVAEHWHELKRSIGEALQEVNGASEEKFNNMLEAILVGRVTCWVSVDRDSKRVDGVLTTRIIEDDINEIKSLLLLTVTSIGGSNPKSWEEGFVTLGTYAVGQGCSRIIAYSNNPLIYNHAKSVGGKCDYRMMEFDLS